MSKIPTFCGWIALALLTLAGLLSCYQVAFSVWMTAYPKADINFWRPHLYFRLMQGAAVAVLWILVAVWLLRRALKNERPAL
jgi:hypothetical protein